MFTVNEKIQIKNTTKISIKTTTIDIRSKHLRLLFTFQWVYISGVNRVKSLARMPSKIEEVYTNTDQDRIKSKHSPVFDGDRVGHNWFGSAQVEHLFHKKSLLSIKNGFRNIFVNELQMSATIHFQSGQKWLISIPIVHNNHFK